MSVRVLAAALAVSVGLGAAHAEQNLLLGKWQFVKAEYPGTANVAASCPYVGIVFAAKTQTLITQDGKQLTSEANYIPDKVKSYVYGNLGIAARTGYKHLSPDRIQIDAWPGCIYQRAG